MLYVAFMLPPPFGTVIVALLLEDMPLVDFHAYLVPELTENVDVHEKLCFEPASQVNVFGRSESL